MPKNKAVKRSLTKQSKVDKIVNKGNWFMIEIIDRLGPAAVKRNDKEYLYTVWGNWHLIKAPNAEKAFEKAEKLGHSSTYNFINSDKEEMRWEFVGIGDLIPIYEDIEDKAELMWTDYRDITSVRAKNLLVNKKKHLKNIKPYKSERIKQVK